ncbi:trihelix transcription factor ASR3 isoform X2 [Raphanus sativus]|uniref:Trihelix transcription factor ASR3 isoform X2 n=1 Tax=Raphanus sativus TaxID=3726 RepID=A0A6J0NY00_RAPSA|nr:trihelix transcription factor ASR3 isoform X2 [Raphanus sativus]
MADHSGGLGLTREYRKGNWTLNETMVLIEAKKMDDERRMRRSIGLPAPEQSQDSRSSSGNKPAELRWKWIEDYCWRKGCMRSQNQCNDKWDNLMRDYKKVREYERRRVESSFASGSSSSAAVETESYWKMEKSERKERNLPSNMLPQTYQALFDVVESKTHPPSTAATAVTAAAIGSGNGSGGGLHIPKVIQQQGLGFVPKHQMIQPPVLLPLPRPPPPSQPLQPQPLLLPPPPQPSFHAQPIPPTVDTSPAKRRRTMPTTAAGTGAGSGGGNAEMEEGETIVAAALSKSASVIANAIRESEERQDRRHKEVLSLQERRLKMEESNVEMNREGMSGLVEAINKLASSMFALASSSSSSTSRHNNQHQGGPL